MKPFGFEHLEVWQRSRVLVKNVYEVSGYFPNDERYSLTSQLRRAALSVSCNLAEGNSRITGKEQARYSEIAYGSLLETMNLIIIATDFGWLSEESQMSFRDIITEIGNKVNKLRKTQLARAN